MRSHYRSVKLQSEEEKRCQKKLQISGKSSLSSSKSGADLVPNLATVSEDISMLDVSEQKPLPSQKTTSAIELVRVIQRRYWN
jgi:hypothetical protein